MAKLSFHYRAELHDGDVSLYVDDEHAITLHLAELPNLHLENGELSPEATAYLIETSEVFAEKASQPRFAAMLPQLFALYESLRGTGMDATLVHGTARVDADFEYPDDWQHDHEPPDDPGGIKVDIDVTLDKVSDVASVFADVLVAPN